MGDDAPCAPIFEDDLPLPLRRSHNLLRILCCCVGYYGVVFGAWTIFVALFVNLWFLFGSLAHMALGGVFLFAAQGMARHRHWAAAIALAASLLCGAIAGITTMQLIDEGDLFGLLSWWGPITVFFAGMALLSLYCCLGLGRANQPA